MRRPWLVQYRKKLSENHIYFFIISVSIVRETPHKKIKMIPFGNLFSSHSKLPDEFCLFVTYMTYGPEKFFSKMASKKACECDIFWKVSWIAFKLDVTVRGIFYDLTNFSKNQLKTNGWQELSWKSIPQWRPWFLVQWNSGPGGHYYGWSTTTYNLTNFPITFSLVRLSNERSPQNPATDQFFPAKIHF